MVEQMSAEEIIDMYYPHGGCPEIVREMVLVAYDAGMEAGKVKK